MEKDVFPFIGKKPISNITALDVLATVQKMEARGAIDSAHRVKQICGQVFRFGVANGFVERDVTTDLRGALLAFMLPNECVAAHRGEHKVKDFSCLDQFFSMALAQLTYRESLRDIEINLRAQAPRLYHMGFRCNTISRNTLANANATRSWQIYADFAQNLIGIARPLYASEPLGSFALKPERSGPRNSDSSLSGRFASQSQSKG